MSGGSSPPPAPDPTVTANAQSAANVSSSAAQTAQNAFNQFTPYGSTTYQQTGSYTTPSGQTVPTYSQYTELSPLAQALLTGEETLAGSQQGLQAGQQGLQGSSQSIIGNLIGNGSAWNLAGQAANSANTPINFNTPYSGTLNNWQTSGQQLNTPLSQQIAAAPGQIANLRTSSSGVLDQGPQLLTQNVGNAIYGQQAGFLNPQWQQQEQQLHDQLSQQGIPVGSQAYNNAMDQFYNSRTQAYQSAQDAATAGATSAANNLFGMALAGQGLGLQQAQAADQAALSGQGLSNAQAQQAFNMALTGQQQNIGQQQLAEQQPLSLLSQLLGISQPITSQSYQNYQIPMQPIATPNASAISPTDVTGAQALSSNVAQQDYQANLASRNAAVGGLASVAAAAAIAI